jgi:hypothetical protein
MLLKVIAVTAFHCVNLVLMTERWEDICQRLGGSRHPEIPAIEPIHSFPRNRGQSQMYCARWRHHVPGTMCHLRSMPNAKRLSQISDLRSQLFAQLPDERFTVFTCGHVIPKENLAALVINKGPGGSSMEFKMANRGDKSLVPVFTLSPELLANFTQISELGRTLLNLTGLVPNGLVVFFPSYPFLGCVKSSWAEDGTLGRLGSKKKVGNLCRLGAFTWITLPLVILRAPRE